MISRPTAPLSIERKCREINVMGGEHSEYPQSVYFLPIDFLVKDKTYSFCRLDKRILLLGKILVPV